MKAALLLLLALPASAEVREIASMAEIVPSLATGTLVVFDIDNTLVEPVGNIGSDQWYSYLVKAVSRDDAGLTPEQAEAKAGEAWAKSLAAVKVKPVEALTPGLIADAQKRGLRVMALTARGPEDAAATYAQLKAVGVDLPNKTVSPMELRPAPGTLYARGVLFAADRNKGELLVGFLKQLALRPAAVVFADDKLHHAKNVDAALAAAGIPAVSFRYGAADAKVKAFNDVMGEADTADAAGLLFHGRSDTKR